MPTPENRSKLLPARGTKAALEASLPDLLDGEMTYATDEARYYQVEDGALVAVGAAGGSNGTTTTADVETTDPVLRMRAMPELRTQQDVNWFIEGEISDIKEDLGMLLNDYTTTDDFNLLNKKVKENTENIESLQGGFDDAVLAAQKGAENLTIELQSYAKKDELPPAYDDSELKEQVENVEAVVLDAFVGEAAIPDKPYPGQQWMNPDTLTVMVFWQGQWVPCAPPVTTQPGVDIPALPSLP